MPAYEFTVTQTTRIRANLTPKQVELIDNGSSKGTDILQNLVDKCRPEGHEGSSPVELSYDIENSTLRELKPKETNP